MRCPQCGNRMEAEEEWIGQAAACPICRMEIVIQKNEETPAELRSATVSAESGGGNAPVLPVAGIVLLYLFMLIPGLGFLTFIFSTILYFLWSARWPEKARNLIRHTLIAALIAIPATLFLTSSILFFPPMYNEQEKRQELACLSNIHQILLAAKMYSADCSGEFPPQSGAGGFETLRKAGYLTETQVFVCRLSGIHPGEKEEPLTEEHVSYLYIGGFNEKDDPNQEMIFCPYHSNCVPVGCADGTVRLKTAGKRNFIHEILEKAGLFKRFDEFPDETKRYIREKMAE